MIDEMRIRQKKTQKARDLAELAAMTEALYDFCQRARISADIKAVIRGAVASIDDEAERA